MPTKDSSCLQGKEGNASVDSNHTVHGGLVQHQSRLQMERAFIAQDYPEKSYDCKSLCESLLKSLRGCTSFGWPNQ